MVTKYCVTCHNEKLKTAGLDLNHTGCRARLQLG